MLKSLEEIKKVIKITPISLNVEQIRKNCLAIQLKNRIRYPEISKTFSPQKTSLSDFLQRMSNFSLKIEP